MPYDEPHTFGSDDPLGYANGDWEVNSAPVTGNQDEYVGKNRLGEFLPDTDKVFNKSEEITVEYVAKKAGAVVPPTVILGAEKDETGFMVTDAELKGVNTGNLVLSVTAHRHIGGIGQHKENPHQIVWPTNLTGFGAFDPFGTSGIPSDQIQSSSFKAGIEHVDKTSRLGAHLVGRSQGVKVEASLEAVTDVDEVSDPTGWKVLRDTKRGNDDFYGLSLRGHRYPGDTWAVPPGE